MYIGDGAKMIRDAFDLAKEKSKDRGGAIIFIDEIDAIGTKRSGGEGGSDGEVQRTMLELLNQLDGFSSNHKIKVIAATNRPDTLDPALLRAGRLDRKIELPLPDEKARGRIMQIHSRKMNGERVGEGAQAAYARPPLAAACAACGSQAPSSRAPSPHTPTLHHTPTVDKEDVNFEELARSTDDFNGAMLKVRAKGEERECADGPRRPAERDTRYASLSCAARPHHARIGSPPRRLPPLPPPPLRRPSASRRACWRCAASRASSSTRTSSRACRRCR